MSPVLMMAHGYGAVGGRIGERYCWGRGMLLEELGLDFLSQRSDCG